MKLPQKGYCVPTSFYRGDMCPPARGLYLGLNSFNFIREIRAIRGRKKS